MTWHTKHGLEELPQVQGQGQQPRVPGCNGTEMAERSYPNLRSGAAAGRSYPMSEVGAAAERSYPGSEARGGSRKKPPCA